MSSLQARRGSGGRDMRWRWWLLAAAVLLIAVTGTAVCDAPPDPTTLTNTTGNFWVNHTWSPGSGNVTDSYNVSINGTWYNGTTDAFYSNASYAPHAWQNITIFAFNASGTGTLSTGTISQDTQIPNNAPTLNCNPLYSIREFDAVNIHFYGDADGDSCTFETNATNGMLNTTTGVYVWNTTWGDNGTHTFIFNVSDGYGGEDSAIIEIDIAEYAPDTLIENWQYHPDADPTDLWDISITHHIPAFGSMGYSGDIVGDREKSMSLHTMISTSGYGGPGHTDYAKVMVTNIIPTPSNYWGFTVVSMYRSASGNGQALQHIYLYDIEGNQISNINVAPYQIAGRWELTYSAGNIYLRINGDNKGIVSACSKMPAYIRFYCYVSSYSYHAGSATADFQIDDITTDADTLGIGVDHSDATAYDNTHIWADSDGWTVDPNINVTYGLKTTPIADYTAARYNMTVRRLVTDELVNTTTIKPAGEAPDDTHQPNGTVVYNATTLFGANYGRYNFDTNEDASTTATDWIYWKNMELSGDSYVSIPDTLYSSGTQVEASYFIDNINLTACNYYIKTTTLYGEQMDISYNLTVDTGSITIDTTGYATMSYWVMLVRENTTNGDVQEMESDTFAISIAHTTGNFWVNHTWQRGSGDTTSSYNISVNDIWHNGTADPFYNDSYTAHAWQNITVYTYNISGSGTLSAGSISQNTQIPNNPITITNTSDWGGDAGENVYVDYDATDADSDTPTYSCNRTDLFTDFDTASGIGHWTATAGTYYVDFGVSDGWGNTSNYTMTLIANVLAPDPTFITNTSGNFWVTHSWNAGVGNVTDSYNVSINGTWYNGTTDAFYSNASYAPHAWQNITVYAYNSSGTGTLSIGSISQNTQIPNNPITISHPSDWLEDVGETVHVDFNETDADGDTPTFSCACTYLFTDFDTATGTGSWTPPSSGAWYIDFGVSDGWGSTDNFTMTIIPNPTYMAWQRNADIVSGLRIVGFYSTPTVFEIGTTWYLISGKEAGGFAGFEWNGTTWIKDSDVVAGLDDIGAFSSPTVFEMDAIQYLVAGKADGTFTGFNWTGSAWQSDSDIVAGLDDIGDYSTPTVFQNDTTWYLVSGKADGGFTGFNWTGSAWQSDSDIVAGLYGNGSDSHPTVFQNDTTWYLISGTANGTFVGFNWTGTAWQNDSSIVNGLYDVGWGSAPTIFLKDEIWHLIAGDSDGGLVGFNWNGTAWQSDSDIVAGLTNVGSSSSPTVFEMDDIWYLISGGGDGRFIGFNWTGSTWQRDSGIIAGLGDIGSDSHPTVFEINSTWYLISGESSGGFFGFNWTGSTWQSDDWAVSGLGDVGFYSTPTVFQMGGDALPCVSDIWWLVSGNSEGEFFGYKWIGSTWIVDGGIAVSMGAGAGAGAGVGAGGAGFYMGDQFYLISGGVGYDWTDPSTSSPSYTELNPSTTLPVGEVSPFTSGPEGEAGGITPDGTGGFIGQDWNSNLWRSYPTIVGGLDNVGSFSSPTAFLIDARWHLISGDGVGGFNGYRWTGSAWQNYDDIVAGLNNSGTFSAPTVFQKDDAWYIVAGKDDGGFAGFKWNNTTWQSNGSIVAGLGDVGADSAPTVFQKNATWYLVSGKADGTFIGFNWTGSAWQSNSSIVAGLDTVGASSHPTVFEIDTTWYLISGNDWGEFKGYRWTGSAWQTDNRIVSGLAGGADWQDDHWTTSASNGYYSAPVFFSIADTHYLVAGNNTGEFSGFAYNVHGGAWESDSLIVNGLYDIGSFSSPTVFCKSDIWYLISGTGAGTFVGFQWNVMNVSWQNDSEIVDGLGDVGSYSTPTVFQKEDARWYLIAGNGEGEFYGYIWNVSWEVDNRTPIPTYIILTDASGNLVTNAETAAYDSTNKSYIHKWENNDDGILEIRSVTQLDALVSIRTFDGAFTRQINVSGLGGVVNWTIPIHYNVKVYPVDDQQRPLTNVFTGLSEYTPIRPQAFWGFSAGARQYVSITNCSGFGRCDIYAEKGGYDDYEVTGLNWSSKSAMVKNYRHDVIMVEE